MRATPTVHRRTRSGLGSRRAHRGMTLMEVVASIAILGVLLVGIVTAKSRHTHQWSLAQRKLQAVAAADALLAGWWQHQGSLPRTAEGEAGAAEDGLRWRTQELADREAAELGVTVVTLQVWDARDPEAREPLVSVDLVLTAPQEHTEPQERTEEHAPVTASR